MVETKHAQWAEAQLLEVIAARITGPDPATIAEVIESVRAEAMRSVGVVDLTPPAEEGDRLRASDGRPVHVPPSAVRYTTRCHLEREVAIVEWATEPDAGEHRAVTVDEELLDGLDDGQVAAVVAMLCDPRPVITVVGPAGAGKTTLLAAAVASWQRAGIGVFGVGPSATAARQLRDGAGTVADTLHKLVYEHSVKQTAGRGLADPVWDLPARSVVIIDESGSPEAMAPAWKPAGPSTAETDWPWLPPSMRAPATAAAPAMSPRRASLKPTPSERGASPTDPTTLALPSPLLTAHLIETSCRCQAPVESLRRHRARRHRARRPAASNSGPRSVAQSFPLTLPPIGPSTRRYHRSRTRDDGLLLNATGVTDRTDLAGHLYRTLLPSAAHNDDVPILSVTFE